MRSDVTVKVETYVKVILSLGLEEARAVMGALATLPEDHATDPVFQALYEALKQIPEEAAA